ncbi:MAG TPA: hypothetical protein VEQ85_05650 [Lacipirellulaceae bacterium]|nr:hypothetical protein [Lacipirellulaceae bacterium]
MTTRNPARKRTLWQPTGGPPTAWLAGAWRQGEFAAIRAELLPGDEALRGAAGSAPQEYGLPQLEAALRVRGALPPESFLVAQQRPGSISQALVDRLQAAAPLARIVIVAGTWCEGELRTGTPLVGAARLYWYEFLPWWRRELLRREARPATPAPHPLAGVVLAVDAVDVAVYETALAALSPYGCELLWAPRGRGPVGTATLGLWDGGQGDPAELASLGEFCQRLAPAGGRVVALLDFPRVEHVAAIRAAGAAALLGKPYDLTNLLDVLARVRRSPPQ